MLACEIASRHEPLQRGVVSHNLKLDPVQVVPERLACPHHRQHLPLVGRVVALMLVE